MADTDIYSFVDVSLYKKSAEPAKVSAIIDPANIDSGSLAGFLELQTGGFKQGKTAFNNTETGFILGIDNGASKFYIGNTTDYLNWDGTVLTIAGTFQLGGTFKTISDIDDFQDAMDDVSSSGGGTVSFVPDTYTGTTNYSIPTGVNVDLSGATIDFAGGAFQILVQGTNAYSTGTVAVNYGSSTVTGTGTTWTSAMVGRSILIGDFWYTITGRNSNTEITISPAFMAGDVSGVTYVIADTVNDVTIQNGVLQNSSTSLIKFRYLNTLIIDSVICAAGGQGIDGDDSAFYNWVNSVIDDCGIGQTLNNVRFGTIDNWNITNITTGPAWDFNGVSNTSMEVGALQSIAGVGMRLTNCDNFGLSGFSFKKCSSHAIEFVSGNFSVDIISGEIDGCVDAVKLTATTDKISLDHITTRNHSGYAVNVAAASCDNNSIGIIHDDGSGSGKINDSGTGTIIQGDDTAYDATSWNGNMGTPTKNAIRDKIEDILDGVTFSGDISVPDEAYGSDWNGSLEVPTKNAVYDKIETLGTTPSCLSFIPQPANPATGFAATDTTFNSNTTQSLYQFVLPFQITVNKISIKSGSVVTTAGTWDLTIYSEDGQTQKIAVTTASVSAIDTIVTTAVSSVVLTPGIYWFAINPNGTAVANWYVYTRAGNAALDTTASLSTDIASEPKLLGTTTITAGTPAATFTPSTITEQEMQVVAVIFRLDN